MTKFRDTDEGRAFVASGPSRETDPEIMGALAFFARDLGEAEWPWGAAGRNWSDSLLAGQLGSVR